MYASTHMNSRGCPGGSYKRGIKTVGQAPRLRTDLGTSSRLVFRCGPQRRHFQASRAAPLSGISEGKRGRDEDAAAYLYSDCDTAENRENALPTIGRLRIGSGSLRR